MRAAAIAVLVCVISGQAVAAMMQPGQYDVLSPEQHKVLTIDVQSSSYDMKPDRGRMQMVQSYPVQEQMQAISLTQCSFSSRSFGMSAMCKIADPVTGSAKTDETAILTLKIEGGNTAFPRLSGQITLLSGVASFSQSNFHIKNCSLRPA